MFLAVTMKIFHLMQYSGMDKIPVFLHVEFIFFSLMLCDFLCNFNVLYSFFLFRIIRLVKWSLLINKRFQNYDCTYNLFFMKMDKVGGSLSLAYHIFRILLYLFMIYWRNEIIFLINRNLKKKNYSTFPKISEVYFFWNCFLKILSFFYSN